MYSTGWVFKSLHIGITNLFQRSEKKNERKREETREERRKERMRRCFPMECTSRYFPKVETGPHTVQLPQWTLYNAEALIYEDHSTIICVKSEVLQRTRIETQTCTMTEKVCYLTATNAYCNLLTDRGKLIRKCCINVWNLWNVVFLCEASPLCFI